MIFLSEVIVSWGEGDGGDKGISEGGDGGGGGGDVVVVEVVVREML